MQTEAIFENIAERIHQEISNAQKSIFIAVAWFTNKRLFEELLHKAKNGCTVTLIISNDHINSTIAFDRLAVSNSMVYRIGDGDMDLMHNKFCVIDYNTVITGSYNWSYKAENNFENVIITKDDTALAEQFIAEFNKIRKLYYPDEIKKEPVFPIDKIMKRLEILKNYIVLEDTEALDRETPKLKEYDFNSDIQQIISDIKRQEFAEAVGKIQWFISSNQQLSVWTDPELAALKLEIKNLENKLNAFDNEKTEIEKLFYQFNHRHAIELGEIILEILRLRKLKFKADNTKFKEAEADEKQYRKQVESEKGKVFLELDEEQKIEIKKKFRKASGLCHPDKVCEEFKESAHEKFIELKQAYDTNDLERVSKILDELESDNYFKSRSETISAKVLLKAAIDKLRKKIQILETEIVSMKQSNTFKTVTNIDDWDKYFEQKKVQLQEELDRLKLEIES